MNDLMMAMMAAKAVGGSGSGGLRGANGLSAYELYVRQGGTLSLQALRRRTRVCRKPGLAQRQRGPIEDIPAPRRVPICKNIHHKAELHKPV